MKIDITFILILMVLVPSIIALVQEKADKVSVISLVVSLCGSGIALLHQIYPRVLGSLPRNATLAIIWITVMAMTIAAIIAGIRIRNRICATLMVTGAVVSLLILCNVLKLGNFYRP